MSSKIKNKSIIFRRLHVYFIGKSLLRPFLCCEFWWNFQLLNHFFPKVCFSVPLQFMSLQQRMYSDTMHALCFQFNRKISIKYANDIETVEANKLVTCNSLSCEHQRDSPLKVNNNGCYFTTFLY